VIDGDTGKLTSIDPKTDNVVGTIGRGRRLEFGVSGGNGKVYVNAPRKARSSGSTRHQQVERIGRFPGAPTAWARERPREALPVLELRNKVLVWVDAEKAP